MASAVRIASRRSGIDRVWGTVLGVVVLVIGAVLAGVVLLAMQVDDSGPYLMLLPLAPFTVLVLWMVGRTWRQLRSITIPLELDPVGLVLRAPQGSLRCPWEAVASIGFGRLGLTRTLVVRLHPQAGPGAPGIETTLPPRAWRTIQRHGLRYAAWLLDIDDQRMAAAVADLSGGRVHLVLQP
ncbi:hypothetical protein BH10ACT1_BH10ACT1_07070 [soil metagenome]